jgi:hypothetical protein
MARIYTWCGNHISPVPRRPPATKNMISLSNIYSSHIFHAIILPSPVKICHPFIFDFPLIVPSPSPSSFSHSPPFHIASPPKKISIGRYYICEICIRTLQFYCELCHMLRIIAGPKLYGMYFSIHTRKCNNFAGFLRRPAQDVR